MSDNKMAERAAEKTFEIAKSCMTAMVQGLFSDGPITQQNLSEKINVAIREIMPILSELYTLGLKDGVEIAETCRDEYLNAKAGNPFFDLINKMTTHH